MDLRYLIKELFSLIETMGISIEKYPEEAEDLFQVAIAQKRQGLYFESLVTYSNLICDYFPAYAGILNGLYKTIACAGYLKDARKLLKMCNNEVSYWFGSNNNFNEHLNKLERCVHDQDALIYYLSSISGNPNYQLPRNYNLIMLEYFE